jgi:hypothetical protein
MRPLTSIIAAATLGTKPETFRGWRLQAKEPVDYNRSRLRPHPADQLVQCVFLIVSRRSPGSSRSHPWAGLRLTPECQLAMTSKPGMEIGDNSEVARLYQ